MSRTFLYMALIATGAVATAATGYGWWCTFCDRKYIRSLERRVTHLQHELMAVRRHAEAWRSLRRGEDDGQRQA